MRTEGNAKETEMTKTSRRDAGIAIQRALVAKQDAEWRAMVEKAEAAEQAAEQPAGIDWTKVGAN
jgi:hypothetical protein